MNKIGTRKVHHCDGSYRVTLTHIKIKEQKKKRKEKLKK